MTKNKEYIYFRESFIQSFLSDTYVFAVFIAVMWINFTYLGNNGITTVFLIGFWFIWIIQRGMSKQRRFTNIEDLKAYILKEEQDDKTKED